MVDVLNVAVFVAELVREREVVEIDVVELVLSVSEVVELSDVVVKLDIPVNVVVDEPRVVHVQDGNRHARLH